MTISKGFKVVEQVLQKIEGQKLKEVVNSGVEVIDRVLSSPSPFKRASLLCATATAPVTPSPALAGGAAMETLMVDRVNSSLRLFMHRNAVFLCERLCAQFPSEVAARFPFSFPPP
jgi:hypothetical protein